MILYFIDCFLVYVIVLSIKIIKLKNGLKIEYIIGLVYRRSYS